MAPVSQGKVEKTNCLKKSAPYVIFLGRLAEVPGIFSYDKITKFIFTGSSLPFSTQKII